MPLRTTSHRRFLLPLILAVVLAGEVAGLAVAARIRAPTDDHQGPVAAATEPTDATGRSPTSTARGTERRRTRAIDIASQAQSHVRPTLGRGATVRPAIAATAQEATALVRSQSASAYRGRNHVWIPSLGIDRSVGAFPCSRTRPPDNNVYRWGCAGKNNVYLLGHAYSVFKPLHDAYVRGRLAKGMKVIYADGSGLVRTYSVIWWKVTRPTPSAAWAWAAQSKPSMTLQTCVGANGELRLMVRLVATG